MLPSTAYCSFILHPCGKNELWITFLHDIKVRIDYIFSIDRFTKVCFVVYAILDTVLWVGVFVLEKQCGVEHNHNYDS
jgi:hypothetical protein